MTRPKLHPLSLLMLALAFIASGIYAMIGNGFFSAATLSETATPSRQAAEQSAPAEPPTNVVNQTDSVVTEQQSQTPKQLVVTSDENNPSEQSPPPSKPTEANSEANKERFIPTEEISEDLAVSFPVDI